MQDSIKVSIVILCYNQLHCTVACWESLQKTLGGQTSMEYIFVDNASSDDTPEFLKSIQDEGRVQILRNDENLGYAKGCNQGARAAFGEFLLFLNNDTVALPGWLEPMLQTAQKADVGIVGSKLLYPDRSIQHAGVVMKEHRHPGRILLPDHIYIRDHENAPWVNHSRELQAVTGACLLIRKDLFFSAGAFDEVYVNGYEDVDLCFKIRERGLKVVYCAESVLLHHESMSEGRHEHNDFNYKRLDERWGEKVKTDNRAIYEKDGRAAIFELRNQIQEMESYMAKIQRHDAASRTKTGATWSERLKVRLQQWLGISAVSKDLAAIRSTLFRIHQSVNLITKELEEHDRDRQARLYGNTQTSDQNLDG